MPRLRSLLLLALAALGIAPLWPVAPAHARGFEHLAPIKRLQAQRLAREPMERRQERREFVERQRELRRLAKQMKQGGRTTLRVGGERARRDETLERLPLLAAAERDAAGPASGNAVGPTNVRCNNPSGDTAGDGQCETSLVAWHQYMLAAWNDGKGFHDGSQQFQGWATSTDGGLTWTDRGTIPLPTGDANWSWTSDPVLAVNSRTGAFYFSALVDPDGAAGSTNGIAVVKGRFTNSTFAWGNPSLVRSVNYSTDFLDKQWIAVDPGTGKVYVSYTRFASNVSEINFQASDSSLTSWSSPLLISVTSNNANLDERGLVQGSRPVVGPDGTLFVMYYRIGLVDVDYQRVAKSTNFGASFGAPVTATTFYPNFATGGPGFNRSMGIQFASAAADHSEGVHRGRLYLSWAESLNWFDDLGSLGTGGSVSEIEPNGTFATATPFTSGFTLRGQLAVSGAEEDWFKATFIAGQNMTFMADSMAPGMSFSMRVFGPDGASRLAFTTASSTDIVGEVGPAFPFTAPTAGTYYFRLFPVSGFGGYRVRTGAALHGSERGRDQRDAFVSWSDDKAATWSTPVRVSDSAIGYDDWLPEVAVLPDGHTYAAWYDFRDSPGTTGGAVSHTYLSRSDDGGSTWGSLGPVSSVATAWTNVNTNIQPNQGDYLALFGYDRGVVACWSDGRDGDPNAYMALTGSAMRADVTTALATSDTTVLVNWQLTPSTLVTPNVWRRNLPGGAWSMVATLPGAAGATSFEDDNVVVGATYEYRLGITIDGEERFYGHVTVVMPSGPTPPAMAITGVFPNPVDRAAASAPRVAYRLRGTAPARMELLDISGRLVHTYELGTPGPGAHEFALPAGGGIRPGVYLLRLVQGSDDVTRRISILR
ncbi:MAG: hypothetical protein U0704_02480 [Candidatus Eisenbacteria bacterium]